MFLRSDTLSDALFHKFSALIYAKTGISLKIEKKELLTARLGKRLRACRIGTFKEYYNYVSKRQDSEEFTHFINSVSTNFTSFFRENSHFNFLTSIILPKIAQRGKEIVIWSAACSSGEEPYTIAMVAEDYFQTHPRASYRIMATDISTKVLEQAQKGIYALDRVEKVPQQFLRQYFQKGIGKSAGYVKVKENIRKMISFQQFNLMGDFPWKEQIDIIFCRNVMIYFDRETQQSLINKFYDCLVPGGYLLIGHSESISSIKHKFTQLEATTYQK